MYKKVLTSGIRCLLGGDYENIYQKLIKHLTGDCQGLFTERRTGPDYLQWNLPGDGWKALSECDPITASEVQRQLDDRLEQLRQRYGDNKAMADMVLTVPSNEFIFYKTEPDGKLKIALTAWGYRYPERIDIKPIDGDLTRTEKEKVQIAFDWDGKHLPNVPFKLKDMLQQTNDSGIFAIHNEIEVGHVIPIVIAGKEESITVVKGQQLYTFDLTKRFNIEVSVTRDGKPAANTTCKLTFGNKTLELTTDDNGHVNQSLAFEPDRGKVADPQPECKITCEDQAQSLTPSLENNNLQYSLQLETKRFHIEVTVTRDGKPVAANTPIKVDFGGNTQELVTDDNGHASQSMTFMTIAPGRVTIPQPECIVTCEDKTQSLTPSLENNKLEYSLQLDPKQFHIEVVVTRDGNPAANTPIKVDFGGKTQELVTDDNGHASQSMSFIPDPQGKALMPQPECTVTCEDKTQSLTPSIKNNKLQYLLQLVTPVAEPKFLSLSFLDCKGRPMPGIEIHVTNKAGKQFVAVTDETGKVMFPRENFQNGEKPKIEFVVSKEYQQNNPGTYK